MINVTFIKDYSRDFNIKFDGLKIIDIVYKEGKVIEIIDRKNMINYVEDIEKFKNEYKIKADDVITLVDMYFANEFSIEYIGKGIFNKGE